MQTLLLLSLLLLQQPSALGQQDSQWAATEPGAAPKSSGGGKSSDEINKSRGWGWGADIDAEGPCKGAIADLCAATAKGKKRVAKCLRSANTASIARGKPALRPSCKAAVDDIFIDRAKAVAKDISLAPELALACHDETQGSGVCASTSSQLECLKKKKAKLSSQCKAKVFEEQLEQATDIRMVPELFSNCKSDIEGSTCKDVTPGEGRVRACLAKKYKASSLTSACRTALFEAMIETSEDIRLDKTLLASCSAETAKFCADTSWGSARIQQCLYNNRAKPVGFGASCKAEIEAKVTSAAQDYRLDWRLKSKCAIQIPKYCEKEKAIADVSFFESGVVVTCLKSKLKVMVNEECKTEVIRVAGVQAEHWQASKAVVNKCSADQQRFCSNKKEDEVQDCLRSHMKKLSADCKSVQFKDVQIESSVGIELKPRLKARCKSAIENLCSDVSDGLAVMECLQTAKAKDNNKRSTSKVSTLCKAELLKDEQLTATDWRLKNGLSEKCDKDIDVLCPEQKAAKKGGTGADGSVLQCLADARDKVQRGGCRSELAKVLVSHSQSASTNPVLMAACMDDVSKHCGEVEPGHGRVHDCLETKVKLLSPKCLAEEFKQLQQSSEQMSLNPRMASACASVLKAECSEVEDQAGALQRCLEDHKSARSMTSPCLEAMNGMTQLKNSDYRLNPELQKNCKSDIKELCPTGEWQVVGDQAPTFFSGNTLQCLITKRADIKKKACKDSVFRKQAQRTDDIRNDPKAFDACKSERESLCVGVEDGGGRIHKCLYEHYAQLSQMCQDFEFKTQVMKSESVALNPFLLLSCLAPIKLYCADTSGRDKMKCLIDNKYRTGVSEKCRGRLEEQSIKESKNLAFKPGTTLACAADLVKLKANKKCDSGNLNAAVGGFNGLRGIFHQELTGVFLKCLVDNVVSIESASCKEKVREINRATSNDIRASPGSSINACTNDIVKFCVGVQSGQGRMNRCLQDHIAELSPACAEFEGSIMKVESKDATMNPFLRTACSAEARTFCADVRSGEGRMMGCLKSFATRDSFSKACAAELMRFPEVKPMSPSQPAGDANLIIGLAFVLGGLIAVVLFKYYVKTFGVEGGMSSSKSYTKVSLHA